MEKTRNFPKGYWNTELSLSLFLSANIYPEHWYAESFMLIPVSDLNLGLRVYIAGITLDFRKKKRRKLYYLLLSFLLSDSANRLLPFSLRQKKVRDGILDNPR